MTRLPSESTASGMRMTNSFNLLCQLWLISRRQQQHGTTYESFDQQIRPILVSDVMHPVEDLTGEEGQTVAGEFPAREEVPLQRHVRLGFQSIEHEHLQFRSIPGCQNRRLGPRIPTP